MHAPPYYFHVFGSYPGGSDRHFKIARLCDAINSNQIDRSWLARFGAHRSGRVIWRCRVALSRVGMECMVGLATSFASVHLQRRPLGSAKLISRSVHADQDELSKRPRLLVRFIRALGAFQDGIVHKMADIVRSNCESSTARKDHGIHRRRTVHLLRIRIDSRDFNLDFTKLSRDALHLPSQSRYDRNTGSLRFYVRCPSRLASGPSVYQNVPIVFRNCACAVRTSARGGQCLFPNIRQRLPDISAEHFQLVSPSRAFLELRSEV